jgi:hypothetical protein
MDRASPALGRAAVGAAVLRHEDIFNHPSLPLFSFSMPSIAFQLFFRTVFTGAMKTR